MKVLTNSLFTLTVLVLLVLQVPPHFSLLLGLGFGISSIPPAFVQRHGKDLTTKLLQASVVLLGAALNFHSVIQEGTRGLGVSFVSLVLVLLAGTLLARALGIPSPLSTLLSVGTSICGGSAISAVAPVLNASGAHIGAAMAIVFLLNGAAVFLFPVLGHFFGLSQEQFGTWAALAIHDTSSVVAAGQIYGEEALKIATTLKLARALWIVPLTVVFSYRTGGKKKIFPPLFIVGFLLTSALFTFIDNAAFLIPWFKLFSRSGLSLTLFLIGSNLKKDDIRQLGARPFFFGLLLWLVTLVGALLFVKSF